MSTQEIRDSGEPTEPISPERVEFKNSRGVILVGDFYSASSDAVVILSHGLGGNRHEGGRLDEAAERLNSDLGLNVLQYDFSAMGESEGEIVNSSNDIDDLESALDFTRERGMTRFALLGYSFGGYITASAYDDKNISALVLWAPVISPMPDPAAYYLVADGRNNPNNLEMLRELGYVERKTSNRASGSLLVGSEVFEKWSTINKKDLLSRIKCPVLIVHGSIDPRVPLQGSQDGMQYLPEGSKLKVIDGADHVFDGHVDELIQETVDWFKGRLVA